MTTVIHIEPNRFIASGGKLDSLNGYMAQTTLGDHQFYFYNGASIKVGYQLGLNRGFFYNMQGIDHTTVGGDFNANMVAMRALF